MEQNENVGLHIKSIRHSGIVVKDIEKSLRFYRDLLGLKVESYNEEKGDYIDNLLSLENTCVITVKLSADTGSTLIELLEFKSHPDNTLSKRSLYTLGPSHVAFTVYDVDILYEKLKNAGIFFNSPPLNSPDGKARVIFCKDPDDNYLEFVQIL